MFQAHATRRILPVFYVLDTSGSMEGESIECLNAAMEETILVLKDLAYHNGDALVKVAVLSFSSDVHWMQPEGPEDLEDFVWEPLKAGGFTYMGAAVRELSKRLTPEEYLKSYTGSLMPVIIFMTDGYANDDYKSEFKLAMQNGHFRNATRVGFAIGKSPDVEMLSLLTGSPDNVIQTDDLDQFSTLIKLVSATATKVASVTHGTQQENLAPQIMGTAKRMVGMEENTTNALPAEVSDGTMPIWDMSPVWDMSDPV